MKIQLGEIQLSSQEEMMYQETEQEVMIMRNRNRMKEDQNKNIQDHKKHNRDRHCLSVDSLIEYLNKIESDANLEPFAPVKLRLFREIEQHIRSKNIMAYKRIRYHIVDDQNYEEIK